MQCLQFKLFRNAGEWDIEFGGPNMMMILDLLYTIFSFSIQSNFFELFFIKIFLLFLDGIVSLWTELYRFLSRNLFLNCHDRLTVDIFFSGLNVAMISPW